MTRTKKSYDVVILGGGGHARVLLDAVFSGDDSIRVAVLDPQLEPGRFGFHDGVDVVGGDECAPGLAASNPKIGFAVGLGSVGSSDARSRLYSLGTELGMRPYSVIHTSAIISPSAILADGVQVMAGAVINTEASIGPNAVVNSGAVIEHNCVIEAHANVAPCVCLCGGVSIGKGAFVGAGTVVIQNVHVGSRAVVGAGSVVIRDVSPGATVVGAPARPRK